MPGILTHDCPYCGTRSVAFSVKGKHYEGLNGSGEDVASLIFSCGKCDRGALGRFNFYSKTARDWFGRIERTDVSFSIDADEFTLIEFYPAATSGSAPEHTPPRVTELFRQAFSNFANRNWDASGAMSRKALDVATKLVARGRLGEAEAARVNALWLKKRIEALAVAGLLTPDIADLATLIKDSGDDAAHDEDPYTEVEAAKLLRFSEVLLTYVFTVPGMVAAASGANTAT